MWTVTKRLCVFFRQDFHDFCAPFRNKIHHFKILTMPWVYVFCSLLTRTQLDLAFPLCLEVANTFLIFFFKQNGKNLFRVVQFDTVTLFSFDFPLNVLQLSPVTHCVACSFLSA